MMKKVLALTLAVLMLGCTAVSAATEVIVCVLDRGGSAKNVGFEEVAGAWQGSNNSELNIHYVNPQTNETLARYGDNKSDMEAVVKANLPEAGKYKVYYFVSGYSQDATDLKIVINYKGGKKEVKLNLTDAGKKGFQELGEFEFDAGEAIVNLSAAKGQGFLRFSAMKFVNEQGTAGVIIGGGSSGTTTDPTTAPTVAPTSAPETAPNELIMTAQSKGYQETGQFYSSSLLDALGNKSRYGDQKTSAITYTPTIPKAGEYEVLFYVIQDANGDPAQVVTVNYDGGKKDHKIDCTKEQGWVSLGKYQFAEGTSGNIYIPAGAAFLRCGGIKLIGAADVVFPDSATPTTAPTTSPTTPVTPGTEPTPQPTATPRPRPTPPPTETPTVQPTEQPIGFQDVTAEYDWAREAIETLAEQNIVNGVSATEFNPGADITRAEFVKLAVSLTQKPVGEYQGGLQDVQSSDWYAPYIQAALDAELIDDAMMKEGNFLPDQAITREEMTSIIVKTYEALTGEKAPEGDAAMFTDSDEIADWAKDYVGSAVAMEIIQGVGDNRFAPLEKANRAQATVMISRLMEKTK